MCYQKSLLFVLSLVAWIFADSMAYADYNWNLGISVPEDAVRPNGADPESDEPLSCQDSAAGSIIGCQNQTLGEAVGVVGTPFGLHYQSERVPGRKVSYTVEIPLSGAQVPKSLLRIVWSAHVAGRRMGGEAFPAPNLKALFTWDGKDAYGRTIQGSQPITARIGYEYKAVYQPTPGFGYMNNDGVPGGLGATNRLPITLWRTWQGRIGTWNAREGNGLGGWALSAHHAYDSVEQVLYRGDGGRQSVQAGFGSTISTFAGPGLAGQFDGVCYSSFPGFGADGGPAIGARVCPMGLAAGPDGSLYIADGLGNRVRKVGPNGIITTVAGNGNSCDRTPTAPCGDGGPATQASLSRPQSVAVGPDNSLYITDTTSRRVRKVGPNGVITTIAGTGVGGFSGDGGPGHLAQLAQPQSVAVGPDNSVYIADEFNYRIRRVAPDGIISTVAGTGGSCNPTASCGDGGPATLAQVIPRGLAVGPDGSLYISEANHYRVRRVTPDGIIRRIAGTGIDGFSGDGGLATAAQLSFPWAVAVGRDGTVYIADWGNRRIRWIGPDGMIKTLAGTGVPGRTGDGGLALQATLQGIGWPGLAIGPDGSVYLSQTGSNDPDTRVRRIAPIDERTGAAGLFIPAADGSEVYLFTLAGRHLRTVDGLTGALRSEFAYDSAGRLATITDGNGNITTVERDAAGNPTAIVGPFGQRTTLAVNPDGYLDRITSPAGEAVQLIYTADGLLTGLTNPRGHTSSYAHDAMGRLTSATDPRGEIKTLSRTGTNRDYTVTLTSPLGRATAYHVERLSTGDMRLTTTAPAGLRTQVVMGANGTQTATYPDGTVGNVVLGPDPRWGMQAPLTTRLTVTTPGGRVHTTTTQRTATLANPSDVLSLRATTETVTINGRAFTTAYDATTRTITRTSPTGRRTSAVVDDRGRPVQAQFGGLAPSSYSYDAQGRVSTATQGTGAGSRVTRFAYGSNGFLASLTDPLSRTATFTTDADGRVTMQTLPGGRIVGYAYDANGNVSAITPPDRPDHTFSYTERDGLSVYTAPTVGAESSQTRYTYNADRQAHRTDRPDGSSIGFIYDSFGRLGLVDLASGDRSYGYDAAGRLASLNMEQGASLAYTYDGGLPTRTTWSGAVAGSVTRAYDTNFRMTSLSVNDSTSITLQYDVDGLPVQVGNLTLTRNAQNGLVTGTALGTITDTMTYDVFGDPASYTASQGGSSVFSTTYTRDALGRIATKTETIGGIAHSFAYTYDLAGHLTEVRQDGMLLTASYSYDANGNRLSRTDGGGTTTATYDAQDRLIQYGSTAYTYSPNGEVLSKTAGGQTTAYRYDGLGNLTGVTLPGGRQIEYLLDGAGRRITKRVDGALVQSLLYQDGLRPIAELDGASNVVSRFVYTGGVNVPAYLIKGGVTYRIISDHLGSPRLVIDTSTGNVAQRLDYDEFGNVINDTNPGFQPFGFAGGLYDPDTKLVRFGARDYDAETGRWTAKDPIGFAGGDSNLYGYVLGDPVNRFDPLGLWKKKKPDPELSAIDLVIELEPGEDPNEAANEALCEYIEEAVIEVVEGAVGHQTVRVEKEWSPSRRASLIDEGGRGRAIGRSVVRSRDTLIRGAGGARFLGPTMDAANFAETAAQGYLNVKKYTDRQKAIIDQIEKW